MSLGLNLINLKTYIDCNDNNNDNDNNIRLDDLRHRNYVQAVNFIYSFIEYNSSILYTREISSFLKKDYSKM